MDEERKAALIAEKLAAAKKAAPVKKPAVKKAAAKRVTKPDIPVGRAVGGTVGLAATCKTSGCKQQGIKQTFRVPSLGNVALLPAGVVCLVCEKRMRFDLDDVVVERVETDR
jgi:hypothetical protein